MFQAVSKPVVLKCWYHGKLLKNLWNETFVFKMTLSSVLKQIVNQEELIITNPQIQTCV